MSNEIDKAYPLHMAVIDLNIENVKILFKALQKASNSKNKSKEGIAGVNCCDNMSNTPLHFASMIGDLDMIKVLINYGADPTFKNIENLTPVDMMAEHEDNSLELL